MFEMILLLIAVIGLGFWTVHQDHKKTNWFYIVDNVSIDVCRKYDNLGMAMEMYNLCLEDGHEVYIKRLRG